MYVIYVPEAGPLPAPDERGLEALVTLVHAAGRLSSAPSYGPVEAGSGGGDVDGWGPRPPQRLRCFSVVYRGALAPGVAGSRADAIPGASEAPQPPPAPHGDGSLTPRGLFGFLRAARCPARSPLAPPRRRRRRLPPSGGGGAAVAPSPRPSAAAGAGPGSTRLVAWRAGDLLVAAAMRDREGPGSNSNSNSNSNSTGLEGLTAAVEADVRRLGLLFALLASRSLRTAQLVS
eukprot:tig00020629_g12347.t1